MLVILESIYDCKRLALDEEEVVRDLDLAIPIASDVLGNRSILQKYFSGHISDHDIDVSIGATGRG